MCSLYKEIYISVLPGYVISGFSYLTIIRRRRNEYCGIMDYSTIFTESEENNCFSIITQVIIRATAFSFIFFVSSSKTSRNRAVANLKMNASVLQSLRAG